VGVSYQGDIAIDDVAPLNTTCQLTPKDAKPEPIDLSNITSSELHVFYEPPPLPGHCCI